MTTASAKPILPSLALATATLLLAAGGARADLDSYVKAADPSYAWSVEKTLDLGNGASVLVIRLTSQTWHDIPWRHWMYIIRPAKVTHPETALLLVSGGSIRNEPPAKPPGEVALLTAVAQGCGTLIAVLGQVPNQPLLGGLKEDGLIAKTFVKYFETGDDTWPCLLPMTKSAVRAMDAVQAAAREKLSLEVRKFVVTGASKRGWTTWLTGVVDPRVAAIAPMVIDTLNFPRQMELQVRSFGKYSEQIADYTELGLQEKLKDPGSRGLLSLVDPYIHRARLTLPKLIVLGTNDRYWPVDAVKLYFGDLPGEKLLHYVPNAGHGLGPGAVEAVAAFHKSVVDGERRPRFTWGFKVEGAEAVLSIDAEDAPLAAELWSARAPTRDFREASWKGAPMEKGPGRSWTGRLPAPPGGFSALFGRLTYGSGLGSTWTLATNVEVVGDPPAASGAH